MMQFHWPLFLWYFGSLRLLTALTMMMATSYVVVHQPPLSFWNEPIAPVVLAHSILIACLVSPTRRNISLFVLSQGFSRQAIWLHSWLAAIASVGLTVLPSAILILLGLRGLIQDALLNPWFPLMANSESYFLAWVAAEYLILLPVLRYATVRLASPDQDFRSGLGVLFIYLLIGILVYIGIGFGKQRLRPETFQDWFIAGLVLISISLGILGYKAMKRTEAC